ncbi:MAG: carboxypeptidase-like regulatory domain-containing protein [Bacteroidetes bacterium]|nr:carboxypeptidase-like regulatory domain-containing protein [Bacteroidota bacterium]
MKFSYWLLFFVLVFTYNSSISQQVDISGTVSNSKSQPIAQASVYLLNSNQGAVTDEHGNFSIKSLAPGSYELQVSCIGYAAVSREIMIGKSGNTALNFTLQEESMQLGSVLVSSEKREAFAQKVPVSVTNISARQSRELRLWNSSELTAVVPNLYAASSGDDRNVTGIRGIATTSYDPAVATYIDGVNQFSLDTYIAALSDIERIEILRGPQGSLYGRNAMGGVINIITKQPGNSISGFAELNIGNYAQQRYSASIRIPIY